MTRFCPYCGTQIRERARFCPKCGKTTPPRKNTVALEGAAPVQKDLVEKMNRAAVAESLPSVRPNFDKGQKPVSANGASQVQPRIAPPTYARIGVFQQAGFGLRYGAWMFDF